MDAEQALSDNTPYTELEKLIEARGKATPERWQVSERCVYALIHHGWRKGVEQLKNRFFAIVQEDNGSTGPTEAQDNASFIASAANWVSDHAPSILAEREKDRARIERLEKALRWYVDNDETNEGVEPLAEYGGKTWDQINALWLAGKNEARAALAGGAR